MSQMSVPDVDMRGSAKRPILEVEADSAPVMDASHSCNDQRESGREIERA